MPLSNKKGIRAEKEATTGAKIELNKIKKRSRELPSTYEKKILETKQTKRLKSGGWHEHVKKIMVYENCPLTGQLRNEKRWE